MPASSLENDSPSSRLSSSSQYSPVFPQKVSPKVPNGSGNRSPRGISRNYTSIAQTNGAYLCDETDEIESETDDDEEMYVDAVEGLSPEEADQPGGGHSLRCGSGTYLTASRTPTTTTTTTTANGRPPAPEREDDEDDSVRLGETRREAMKGATAARRVPERNQSQRVHQKSGKTHVLPGNSTIQACQPTVDSATRPFPAKQPESPSAAHHLTQRRLRFSLRTYSEGGGSDQFQNRAAQPSSPPSTRATAHLANTGSETTLLQKTGLPPLKNVQFQPTTTASNLKSNPGVTSSGPIPGGGKPVRPSILKTTPFIASHRATCPKSHPRHRNMSGDLLQSSTRPHPNPNPNPASSSSSSSTPSSTRRCSDPRRWRLFGSSHSEEDPPSYRQQHPKNTQNGVDEHFYDAPATTPSTTLDSPICTCQPPFNGALPPLPFPPTAKSVHILTPTKSEEILFDPAKSVVSSILSINKLASHNQHNQRHPGKRKNPPQLANTNHQQQQTQHCLETAASSRKARQELAGKSDDFKDGPQQRRQQPPDGSLPQRETEAEEREEEDLKQPTQHHHLTPLLPQKHQHHQHRRPPQSSLASNASSDLTEVLFLEEEDESDSSAYHDTVISLEPHSSEAKMSTFTSSTPSHQNYHHHQRHQSDAHLLKNTEYGFFEDEEADQDQTKQDEAEDEEDDYDNPQYCKQCDLWFGSFDPSYPYRCNCNPNGAGAIGPNGTGGAGNSDTLNTIDTVSVYSVHMQKDLRYYFQHPYSRLFIAYTVIFCNFLIFAEDPLSHSLRECSIPVLGNVISFLFTKYPPELGWCLLKAGLALASLTAGLVLGKYIVHHLVLRSIFRLKMFRDESGSWMIMLITTVIFTYGISKIYNALLRIFHTSGASWLISSRIGIPFGTFMKIAACGTWLGDFSTAWMITDMMLQDNLYPDWAPWFRRFWHRYTRTRIVIFWVGFVTIASAVIAIILSDAICWDALNAGAISTDELWRAYLASCIFLMDLLIVMQDWDFPHFVSDLNIKLPGMLRPSYTLAFCRKSVKFPAMEVKVSGKWFNYGIIVFVMMLDLNMWKNQVIYYPADFGQYTDPLTGRVYTVNETVPIWIDPADPEVSNWTTWTYETRRSSMDSLTNSSLVEADLHIFARYTGHSWQWKALSFAITAFGFICFFTLIYTYGRFPPKSDRSLGGRLKKRRGFSKSSWRRERRDSRHGGYGFGGGGCCAGAAGAAGGRASTWSERISLQSGDTERFTRLVGNHYSVDPTRPLPPLTSPYRPSATVIHGNGGGGATLPASLPSSQQAEFPSNREFTSGQSPLMFATPPNGTPTSNSSSGNSTSANSFHRLLPTFSGTLLWSSLLYLLSLLKSRGESSAPATRSEDWAVTMEMGGGGRVSGNFSSKTPDNLPESCLHSAASAAMAVALPPFQPESMLQFQTQFVQLTRTPGLAQVSAN